ncbi:MAG: bifunctional nuclease domain-containing protein [Brevinematia bacterium]
MKDSDLVRVEIEDIVMTNTGFAMIFREPNSTVVLPIYIGPFEANGILMKLQNISFPRPLTYDLFKNVLDSIGAFVEKVVINDLRDNTFYAILFISFRDMVLEIDSRPSDAVALAVRYNAPIFVAEHVIRQAGVDREEYYSGSKSTGLGEVLQEQSNEKEIFEENKSRKSKLQSQNKEDALIEELQRELDKAVAEERYEDAARIRDEIKKLMKGK